MNNKKVITSNIIEYSGIKRITGFTCNIIGEDENNYYYKEFRYSTYRLSSKSLNDPNISDDSKCLWSDYYQLTNKNLLKIDTYDSDILYIQYKFTQNGTNNMYVDSIDLNIEYTDETKSVIPDCFWITKDEIKGPKIIYECGVNGGNNLFNPYDDVKWFSDIYSQLSALVSNMFGLCVTYFKTEPNSKTRDVVLKEYSIEKVIDKQSIKILVPGNKLPTKELQFNSMMIDFPVQFEVHIVKSEFRKVFGQKSHPDPHDYMFFSTYMNKMYMVDSVSEPDDYNYVGSYWRVMLVPYQEMTSVKFDNEELQEDTETLIFSVEGKFEEEIKEEFANNRKDNQLNDINDLAEGQDMLRRILDPNIRIVRENIFNNYVAISKQHYNLSTIDKNKIAVEYTYNKGFSSHDERMITLFFRPRNTEKNVTDNISITEIKDGKEDCNVKKGICIKVQYWDNLFIVGNYVEIYRCGSASGYRKIIHVDKSKKLIYVDGEFDSNCKVLTCARLVCYDINKLLSIRDKDNNNIFTLELSKSNISIDIKGEQFIYNFNNDNFKKFDNKWYCLVVGMVHGQSNMWLYELIGSDKIENTKTKLNLIDRCSNDFGEFDMGENCYYDLISGNVDITNIRLWNKLCDEELHNVILSQYVVDDTYNTLIVDNAQNELFVNYKWS